MKKVYVPHLSSIVTLPLEKWGPLSLNDIVFAYDGNDTIAWLSIIEIDTDSNIATAKVLDYFDNLE